jgi:hypothetical protein
MRLLPLLLCVFPLLAHAADPAPRWWKGNLHTHSLWSDGDDFPEMIADWYKAQGYHFLGLSDHNILADHERWIAIAKSKGGENALTKYLARFGTPWVEQRGEGETREVRLKMLSEFRPKFDEPGRFLMIPSEEITGRVHINATNIREKILPYSGGSAPDSAETIFKAMQYVVSAVNEQRQRTGVPMIAHINHPNFKWAITAEEMMRLEGERFFEIYNGHPVVFNDGDATHASTDRIWDILLTERLAVLGKEPFFGLGTDDSHQYHGEPKKTARPGRGWIMVRAAQLTPEALIAAMEAGDFYASSGVLLKDVRREEDALSVEIEAEPGVTYTTEFLGTRRGYDPTSQPVTDAANVVQRVTRQYSKDIGAVLASVPGPSARYVLKGDEIYVRARITSSKPKAEPATPTEKERAWTQPLVTGVK